jgi:NADPH:quinone reductase
MKAIRVSAFGEPAVLEYVETPTPEREPEQILVRLHAAGINPVEAYVRSGNYARLPALPYTPGMDGAGVVEASPESRMDGQRVYVAGSVTGTYAEYAVCTVDQVHPLPERVSFEQGAALGVPYVTAAWAIFNRGELKSGESVLVHGASGGVGQAATQLAKAAGARVFGTAGTEAGLALIRQNGATAFNHRSDGYLDQISAEADGRGLNMIVEIMANANLGHDLPLLAPRGRVVVIGSRGPVEIDARNLMVREADIRGISLFNTTAEDRADIHRRLGAGLADGSLQPVIGQAFPLRDAAQAHALIMKPGARGKIVLTM